MDELKEVRNLCEELSGRDKDFAVDLKRIQQFSTNAFYRALVIFRREIIQQTLESLRVSEEKDGKANSRGTRERNQVASVENAGESGRNK